MKRARGDGDGDSAGSSAGLDDPIGLLPGAGPRTVERLAAGGLKTVGDLLFHLPRSYDDLRRVTPIAALPAAGEGAVVLVRGAVKRIHVFPHRFLDVVVEEDGASVRARWFRPPRGMEKGFAKGATVALAGPVRLTAAGQAELVHPSNLTAAFAAAASAGGFDRDGAGGGAADALRIRPRYAVVRGVAGRALEAIVGAAVDRYAAGAPDVLPAGVRDRLALPPLGDALRALHRPPPSLPDAALGDLAGGLTPAHRRLAFEDLLILQVGLGARRRQARAQAARPCAADPARALAAARAAFPFALTGAQERAFGEIARDMAAPHPMQRLLIGDVGSGKTAVAFAAAAFAAASGGQALLMAPTEVLAEQHAKTLAGMAAGMSAAPRAPTLRIARLTAATARADREQILDGCRAGAVDILVGTQALFDPRLAFRDLRLAIIDEQHRFGVAQRARFRRSADGNSVPHLLVMSATPIPRTLALTVYGDLDASLLDELPPGRRTPATEIARGDEPRRAAYQRLRDAVAEGRQAFVVCPARDATARAGAATAAARFAELRRELAPAGISVGLIHGALDPARKESALASFAAGAIDVLVATTVVELGIDVPNASVMLIEEADRFGLAQLHQLRGRVGRGAYPGVCFLCTAGLVGQDAARRLERLAATSDGFQIAEADLALRGHGDLFGVRQAGIPRFRFGGLAGYLDLLQAARAEADRIAAGDPELSHAEHRALRAAVDARWSEDAVFGEEAG